MISMNLPRQVFAGEGAMNGLPALLKWHQRAAVLTDKAIRAAGLLKTIELHLEEAGMPYTVFDNLVPEPTVYQASDAIKLIREAKADVLIAVGGGSVMDVAKLASVLDTDDYTLFDLLDQPQLARKTTATIILPTTAGTGAEATPNAIVTLPEKALKVGIVNSALVADTVVLDAELIRNLPQKIAASTAVDALCHAIECFTSNRATVLSDLYALEALRLIHFNIEPACRQGEADMQAKESLLMASFYAGVAIAAAGTTGVHALSYPLGGRYHIPHGLSNAMLLLPVMRFNEPACQDRFALVYDRLNPGGALKDTAEKSAWLLRRLEEMVSRVGLSEKLGDFGITHEDLDELVTAAMQVTRLLVNNKREITAKDARNIYLEAL